MHFIVFDIETRNTFADVGKNDPALLDISVVSIYDSKSDTYVTVTRDELERIWPYFEHADALVGYNSNHFDIPLLDKYYSGSLVQIHSIDILEDIRKSFGKRVRLNSVAEATLGEAKSADGLQAITWWKQGEIEKIKKYCQKDVEITKRLFDYIREHKKILLKEGLATREIPIDTSNWIIQKDSNAMTHTLPF